MVAIQPDVADAGTGNEAQDTLDHAESGAKNRDECELLATDPPSRAPLERCFHRRLFQGQLACRLVGHQHCDLVNELLEDLRRRAAVAEDSELVLDERVANDEETGERGGGVHGAEGTIFARMKEYQAVVLRLTERTKDDEDALTDLMNERSRGGWELAMMTQDAQRLVIVFQRSADVDG